MQENSKRIIRVIRVKKSRPWKVKRGLRTSTLPSSEPRTRGKVF